EIAAAGSRLEARLDELALDMFRGQLDPLGADAAAFADVAGQVLDVVKEARFHLGGGVGANLARHDHEQHQRPAAGHHSGAPCEENASNYGEIARGCQDYPLTRPRHTECACYFRASQGLLHLAHLCILHSMKLSKDLVAASAVPL